MTVVPTTLRYGSAPSQLVDWYPAGNDRSPLLVLLHGGFWRMPYDRSEFDAVIPDLLGRGYAVANVEYRRVGEEGGGWPGTGDDLISALREIEGLPGVKERARPWALVGFSAGGQLALWGAKEWQDGGGTPFAAAVGLAAVSDLWDANDLGLGGGAVIDFFGGTSVWATLRVSIFGSGRHAVRAASPVLRLPAGVRQLLIHGTADAAVPVSMSQGYVEAALAVGDRVELIEVEGGGHLDHLEPRSGAHRALVEWLLREIPPG